MYYYISGKLTRLIDNLAVIDNNGIGYQLTVSDKTAGALSGASDDNILLYTYLYSREEVTTLFGFLSEEELNTFKLLITVSGVGPKAALAILSVLSPEQFALAVIGEDAKSISAAQGVGLKSAQKIIIELKDKLNKSGGTMMVTKNAFSGVSPKRGDNISEAALALEVLGYTKSQALSALSDSDPALAVEELVRKALRLLTK